MFQGDDRFRDEFPPCDLKKTINDLKKIRADYNKKHDIVSKELDGYDESSCHPTDSFSSFKPSNPSNEIMQRQ